MTNVSLQNAGGSHRHASLEQYERSGADLYVTPFEAVERLYRARPSLEDECVWDSSAGLGHIVAAALRLGAPAIGTDLHDHPFPKVGKVKTGVDLFDITPEERLHLYPPTCVVNPPYNQARQHIRHMIGLDCDVYALLRVNFIAGKKASALFPHLREVLLVGRQKMLPPGAVDKGMSPQIDYAWFHFTATKKAADDHGIVLERI